MKQYKNKIIIGLLGLLLLVYLWPILTITWPQMRANNGHYIDSWPDSMSNFLFVDQFIKHGTFTYDEPLNQALDNIVHPRSVNIHNDQMVPMGFLGLLFVYGPLGRVLTTYGVLILSGLLAVLAVYCFYLIVSRLFNQRIGWLAAILLATLPSWLYYAQLPMLPNVLFLSLIIFAVHFSLQITSQRSAPAWLSGLLCGLAIVSRPIEFVWLGALIVIPALFYWLEIKWPQILRFVLALLLPASLLLLANQLLYGNPFYLGYFNLALPDPSTIWQRLPTAFLIDAAQGLIAYIKLIVAPFGLSWTAIGQSFNDYFIKLLWPYFSLFVVGCLWFVVKWTTGRQPFKFWPKQQLVYWLVTILVGLWLVIYYGSWQFDDKLMLKLNTIGISYVRYWLPLSVLLLPGIAYLLDSLANLLKKNWQRYLLLVLVLLPLIFFSVRLAYFAKGDGLLDQRTVINDYYQQFAVIKGLVEPQAVIINDREDKILFPYYSVIMFNGDYSIFEPLKKINAERPLYYLSRINPDMYQQVKLRLQNLGWQMEPSYVVDKDYTLYRLELISN